MLFLPIRAVPPQRAAGAPKYRPGIAFFAGTQNYFGKKANFYPSTLDNIPQKLYYCKSI
jgi:hypothetical protein